MARPEGVWAVGDTPGWYAGSIYGASATQSWGNTLNTTLANWNPTAERQTFLDKYQPYIDRMKNYAFGSTNQWQGPQYQSIGPYTNQYQGSLDSLLSRIQGGVTDADRSAAQSQMLGAMNMTPEQYAQITGNAYQTAEQMQSRADQMATTNSDAYQKFSAMVQSQQRAAVAGMGKQLETIFADRGGLGAFAQAYEMTSAISDQALQYQTQYLMDRSAQALQLIQAENTRNVNLVQAGADMQRQFLNDNWNRLQGAYQDTMMSAQQALQEYQTRADVNAQDYQANLQAFMAPLQAMKDEMMTMLGIDEQSFNYIQSLYDSEIQPLIDALMAEEL